MSITSVTTKATILEPIKYTPTPWGKRIVIVIGLVLVGALTIYAITKIAKRQIKETPSEPTPLEPEIVNETPNPVPQKNPPAPPKMPKSLGSLLQEVAVSKPKRKKTKPPPTEVERVPQPIPFGKNLMAELTNAALFKKQRDKKPVKKKEAQPRSEAYEVIEPEIPAAMMAKIQSISTHPSTPDQMTPINKKLFQDTLIQKLTPQPQAPPKIERIRETAQGQKGLVSKMRNELQGKIRVPTGAGYQSPPTTTLRERIANTPGKENNAARELFCLNPRRRLRESGTPPRN